MCCVILGVSEVASPTHSRLEEGEDKLPRQRAGGGSGLRKACQDTMFTFEDHCLEGKLTFGNPLQGSGVVVYEFANTNTSRQRGR